MKRIFGVVLVLFALVACGGSSGGGDNGPSCSDYISTESDYSVFVSDFENHEYGAWSFLEDGVIFNSSTSFDSIVGTGVLNGSGNSVTLTLSYYEEDMGVYYVMDDFDLESYPGGFVTVFATENCEYLYIHQSEDNSTSGYYDFEFEPIPFVL